MTKIVLHPTAEAQWLELVHEAEEACGVRLSQDLESYLVFTLLRLSHRTDWSSMIFATEILEGQKRCALRYEKLRDVGDGCLLMAGLFPEQASRRLVPISYFVNMGQYAYQFLSLNLAEQAALAQLYASLQQEFVVLMDTLHCARELGIQQPLLTPLQAEELFHDTQSRHALATLGKFSNALPIFNQDLDQLKKPQ